MDARLFEEPELAYSQQSFTHHGIYSFGRADVEWTRRLIKHERTGGAG